jgi:hypothetical protein
LDYLHKKYVSDHNKILEIQQTRRILEIVNPETLKKAINKDSVGSNSNTMKDKLSRYVFKNSHSIQSKVMRDSNLSPSMAPTVEVEENEWAPDRWNRYGFKYQAPGSKTDYLYHPNKVNALGFKYIIGTPTSFKEKNTDKDRSMQDLKA